MMQDTFCMIKPDAVHKRYVGLILCELEPELEIVKMEMMTLSPLLAEILYHEHVDKDFFDRLITFICSGPVVVMQIRAEFAIERLRVRIGATNPAEAQPWTIRAKYGTDLPNNIIHASADVTAAKYELDFLNIIA